MNSKSTLKRRDARKGAAFSSIYVIYSVIFWGYPFVWLFVLAFSKWKYFGSPKFNGIYNFLKLFNDPVFWKSFLNIMNFMLYFIPLVLVGSLLFAMGMKRLKYGKTFVGLAFLLANISSGVAYSIMFSKMFSENGPLNQMLDKLFGVRIPWFTNPQWALFSIVIIVVWKFVGYYGLIIYSGLNSIPKEVYEAAKIDGATRWEQFRFITLPLLNPSIVMILVFSITLSFGIFTEPYMITGGGPLRSTLTPMMLMYTTAFQKMDPAYSATMSILVALMSFGIIWLTRKIVERDVSLT
ncbi:MAG: sugar ABC transporter permease [Thermotogae bacterium]|nr:sugar ABC transporter permease [Thermotogota bacterium]MCP5465230.1 sugar ABC transporter permease [Thermotogota bacterium]HOO75207.1 sugar ABC transporter permease [Tepiditoga sp.]